MNISKDGDLTTGLEALEAEVAALVIRWWHLVFWPCSSVRSVASSFRDLEPRVRKAIEDLRAKRNRNWQVMATAGGLAPWILIVSNYLQLQDEETALSARLERVRFLLISKESEEHAKRSVLLGVVGVLLGAVSLVLGALSLRH